MSFRRTTANVDGVGLVRAALESVLDEICQEGFHGTGSVEITIQDGVIQGFDREVLERGRVPAKKVVVKNRGWAP